MGNVNYLVDTSRTESLAFRIQTADLKRIPEYLGTREYPVAGTK
jgi:cation transport regulator ChaC